MTLDPETIRLGYRLILDRAPNDAEVEAGQKTFGSLQAMRQAFLKSREFHRKYTRITSAADDMQTPALVQLSIPGSAGARLRDQLLKLGNLHPALEIDDTQRDALRQMPAAEQRALRYVYGNLCHGAGRGLEGPHRYVAMLCDPGPRLHALWRGWGGDRSFGDFLELALDDPALRLEVDNGQIRRLAGHRSVDGIGEEQALLHIALYNALSPDMFLGFSDRPEALIATLSENGLFDGAPVPLLKAQVPHPDYTHDLAGLTGEQKEFFDGYTVWDNYCYTVCRQLMLPNPH